MDSEKALQQAIAAIKAGDKITGQQLLAQVISADPQNEAAWLCLATVVDGLQRQRECLHKVLKMNPNNEIARRSLAELNKLPPSLPGSQPAYSSVPEEPKQPSRPGAVAQKPSDNRDESGLSTPRLDSASTASAGPEHCRPVTRSPREGDQQGSQRKTATHSERHSSAGTRTDSSVAIQRSGRKGPYSKATAAIIAVLLLLVCVSVLVMRTDKTPNKPAGTTETPNKPAGITEASNNSARITQEQFGDDWPFTMSEVTVECMPYKAVVVRTDHYTYALNGTAMDAGYDSIRYSSIWLDDPEIGSGYKKSLGPLTEWAVGFCGTN